MVTKIISSRKWNDFSGKHFYIFCDCAFFYRTSFYKCLPEVYVVTDKYILVYLLTRENIWIMTTYLEIMHNCLIKDLFIKIRTKHSTVLLLCLVRNLMNNTLSDYSPMQLWNLIYWNKNCCNRKRFLIYFQSVRL